MSIFLHRIAGNLGPRDIEALQAHRALDVENRSKVEPVLSIDGSPVDLSAFSAVIEEATSLFEPAHRQASDRWLAPRVHETLRLTRRQAGDPSTWEWLAHHVSNTYVTWRWETGDAVPDNRYRGGIHKQAIARLWWGAELFRSGDDYVPVTDFFVKQDFPNSYIHRAFVRNRPLALAVVSEVMRRTSGNPTRYDINDAARVVNLWIAPISVQDATLHWRSDASIYNAWVCDDPTIPSPSVLPPGPPDGRVPGDVLDAALEIARDVCDEAGVTNQAG